VKELVFHLEKLFLSTDMINAMKKYSKERAGKYFSVEAMMKRYYQIIKEIMN